MVIGRILLLAGAVLCGITAETVYAHASETAGRAIIIGASSGMGKEVAKLLAAQGYSVGLAARRIERLQQVQQEIPTQTYSEQIDASNPYEATKKLSALIERMGGLDLLVISITGFYDADFESDAWQELLPIVQVDVLGFFCISPNGPYLF